MSQFHDHRNFTTNERIMEARKHHKMPEQRRKEAEARQAAHDALSFPEKLQKLNAKNLPHSGEFQKLQAAIARSVAEKADKKSK